MDSKRTDQRESTQPTYSYGHSVKSQNNLCSDDDISQKDPDSRPHMQKATFAPKNFYGAGPRGYKRSDVLIKEDICDVLYQDPQIDASEILVEVRDGVVTLEGSVESRPIKHHVEDLVANCFGVDFIHNNLKIGIQQNRPST